MRLVASLHRIFIETGLNRFTYTCQPFMLHHHLVLCAQADVEAGTSVHVAGHKQCLGTND